MYASSFSSPLSFLARKSLTSICGGTVGSESKQSHPPSTAHSRSRAASSSRHAHASASAAVVSHAPHLVRGPRANCPVAPSCHSGRLPAVVALYSYRGKLPLLKRSSPGRVSRCLNVSICSGCAKAKSNHRTRSRREGVRLCSRICRASLSLRSWESARATRGTSGFHPTTNISGFLP